MFDSTNIQILMRSIVEASHLSGVSSDLRVGKSLWETLCDSMAMHRPTKEEIQSLYRIVQTPYGSIKVSFDANLPDNAFEFLDK